MVKQEQYYREAGGITGTMAEYNVDLFVIPFDLGCVNDFATETGFLAMTPPLGSGAAIPKSRKMVMSWWVRLQSCRQSSPPGCSLAAATMSRHGRTLITKAYADARLVQVAFAFEQLAKVRASGPKPY